MANKFEKGDVVVGAKEASKYYDITCQGYTGQVEEVYDDIFIRIRKMDLRTKKVVDGSHSYKVASEYFEI